LPKAKCRLPIGLTRLSGNDMPQLGSDEKPLKLTPNRIGKGSRARPLSVSRQEFSDNWDRIFNKNKEEKENGKTKK